jgi:polyadenylate-binding protein
MQQQSNNLLFLYDLPKDKVTGVAIAKVFKEKANYDLPEPPQIKRHFEKIFYTAIVKINDPARFQEIAKAMKYFKIEDRPCRALPYDRELIGANRQNLAKQNVFLKHIPDNYTSEDVEKLLSEKF